MIYLRDVLPDDLADIVCEYARPYIGQLSTDGFWNVLLEWIIEVTEQESGGFEWVCKFFDYHWSLGPLIELDLENYQLFGIVILCHLSGQDTFGEGHNLKLNIKDYCHMMTCKSYSIPEITDMLEQVQSFQVKLPLHQYAMQFKPLFELTNTPMKIKDLSKVLSIVVRHHAMFSDTIIVLWFLEAFGSKRFNLTREFAGWGYKLADANPHIKMTKIFGIGPRMSKRLRVKTFGDFVKHLPTKPRMMKDELYVNMVLFFTPTRTQEK